MFRVYQDIRGGKEKLLVDDVGLSFRLVEDSIIRELKKKYAFTETKTINMHEVNIVITKAKDKDEYTCLETQFNRFIKVTKNELDNLKSVVMDVREIKTASENENEIKNTICKYTAKRRLMGLSDILIEYEFRDNKSVLTLFEEECDTTTGIKTGENILIIPTLCDYIAYGAIMCDNYTSIHFSEGIKRLGAKNAISTQLEFIQLPKSMELADINSMIDYSQIRKKQLCKLDFKGNSSTVFYVSQANVKLDTNTYLYNMEIKS